MSVLQKKEHKSSLWSFPVALLGAFATKHKMTGNRTGMMDTKREKVKIRNSPSCLKADGTVIKCLN